MCPQLVVYQRIITSASAQYPLAAWLNYDIQFRTLASSDPSLRWDTRRTDLSGPEEGIWDWSGKILWSRPVARNLLGVL